MKRNRGSADTLFTIFTALSGAALALVFIAIGSLVARATFSGHSEHPATHETHH